MSLNLFDGCHAVLMLKWINSVNILLYGNLNHLLNALKIYLFFS